MVFTKNNLVVLLATTGVTRARSVRRVELNKRQGYIPDCTYTIQAISGDTCQTLADFATITVEQFKSYNPQITDCDALNVDAEYCLEKNYGQPDPVPSSWASPPQSSSTTVTVKPTSSSAPVTTSTGAPTSTKPAGTPAPAPTQEGVASNCNRWDVVKSGDSCGVYIAKYPGLTLADLVKFNPAIGAQCTNLWVEYALCTSIEGWKPVTTLTTSAKPTTSAQPTTTTIPGAVAAPGPTQAGVAANCNRWDIVKSGNTCDTFIQKYSGVTLANLVSWNSAIGSTCTGLWLDYYICTSVVGFTPSKTTSTTARPTATSNVPSPVQSGVATNCNRWDIVKSGNTCDTFIKKYTGITLANLVSWNPAIGSTCTNLWLDYYICTGVTGFTPPKTTSTANPPTPTSTVPSPVQAGINSKCKKYHKVVSGNGCYDLAAQYKISLPDFYAWNPAVKNDCSSLWAGYYVCVGI